LNQQRKQDPDEFGIRVGVQLVCSYGCWHQALNIVRIIDVLPEQTLAENFTGTSAAPSGGTS
jgi:hypothetical protein